MTPMKTLRPITSLLVTLAFGASALAQLGNPPPPPSTPESRAATAKVQKLDGEAALLLRDKRYEEAIAAYRRAIQAQTDYRRIVGSRDSGHHVSYYGIARALTGLGRDTEALDAYREAIGWNDNWPDFTFLDNSAMDYAILLARQGRSEDAKTMYYAGLRVLNFYGGARDEPSPLLVVFDPDPDAVVWTYTPQRLEAAALMAKAIYYGYAGIADADAARKLAPDWSLPVLFRAFMLGGRYEGRDADYALAASLAKTADERASIFWAKGWDRDARTPAGTEFPTGIPRPADRRRGLRVLQASRDRMKERANRARLISE